MTKTVRIVTGRRPPRWALDLGKALRSRGVDVVLSEGTTPETEIISLDRRLRLSIGDARGGIPAFGQAVTGAESVDVSLLEEGASGTLLVRSGCFPYASCHRRTLERIVNQCAVWILEELTAATPRESMTPWQRPQNLGDPRPIDRARFYVRETLRCVHHALRFAFEEVRWDVAVTKGSIESFISNPEANWLVWLARDHREFLADPFVVSDHSGAQRVLCETLQERVPTIVSIDLDDRAARNPVATGGPASYPYAFEVDGELWITPEQHRKGRLEVYRYRVSGAHHVQPLLDVPAVDPTIVQYDGLWWLFCTHEDDAPNYALRIYWSEHPGGPWHPHLRNPAKVDVTGARPAGTFFVHDGVLYRPAQDCTARYGRAIAIQRVDVLTPERFEETCVARIDASMLRRKGAVGVHTLSHGFGWIAIDAQFARWSLRKPLRLLRERFA